MRAAHVERQRRADPEQRPPRRRQAPAARARGLAAAASSQLVEGDGARSGFQEDHVFLRTADQRRLRRLGALRLREDARLPLGHLPRRPGRRTARSASATTSASRSGSRSPASTGTRCGASSSPRATPSRRASSSSACSAHSCPSVYDLRNLFQVNVEEGRHLWAMVYLLHSLLRPRRPRGGRGPARAPQRRRGQAAHPRRLQRAVHRLALVLHVHVLHRPRRQVPAPGAGRERVRPPLAHDALHAHRRGAPHVRRRDRRRCASSSARRS